jgi:alkylation response protein AidB-like acyl-CoA dehydrogenase
MRKPTARSPRAPLRLQTGGASTAQRVRSSRRKPRRCFLVSATIDEDEGSSLFLLPAGTAGLAIHGYGLIDGGRAGDVSLSAVEVGPDALVGSVGKADAPIARALGVGLLALSAEALGAMARQRT